MIPNSARTLTFVLGVGALSLFIAIQTGRNRKREARLLSVIPSPLKTVIPAVTDSQISRLAYPPDYFPGGRDVETPFGSIRVYEFGPDNGQKILFVHGI